MSVTASKPAPAASNRPKPYLAHHARRRVSGWVASIVCAAGIFLLLPFTQIIASLGKKPPEALEVEVAIAPPPPPLDLEPPEPPPPPPPPPEVEPPPKQLSLSQLDVALNLGTGDALAGSFSIDGFGVTADDTAGDLSLFDLKDLDKVPRLVQQGRLVYPPDMKRSRVTGVVTLEIIISETGSVSVDRVVDATNREFSEAAVAFANGCRFEVPKKGGKAVRARYTWPIKFSL